LILIYSEYNNQRTKQISRKSREEFKIHFSFVSNCITGSNIDMKIKDFPMLESSYVVKLKVLSQTA